MEFGFALPGRGPLAKPDVVLRMAAQADSLRYDSIFVTDHVVLPASMARSVYPYSTTGQLAGGAAQDYLEPLAMLGYLAHATKRVRLGTSVLVVPYRNPLVTAKTLATIDQLSRGRLILGAGVGWLREEFEALAAPAFEARGEVTDEYLRLMRATWTTDPVTFEGKHYRVREVHALPKPAQPGGIPIWIGGHTDAALKRAGTLGDAWHPIGLRPPAMLRPDEYAQKVKQIHAWAQRAGRDPKALTLTFRAPMEVRSRTTKAATGERPLLQGTAAEVAGDLQQYAALGVTHFVFDPTVPDLKSVLANMEHFADDVRPKLKHMPTARHPRRAPASRHSRQ
ncbi:MAG: LLM class F420-dependent oxidoreductase [Candidatus Rokuibacteriota bacterium]|nr:MAG: LLM class F420-dependent oxidoreductase [Candidatus Rokubacteria bacterium]PYN69146.1 MAG: LLM class F420-dependent oxidoreductase [Candidatus Rokubacteria bacterium]